MADAQSALGGPGERRLLKKFRVGRLDVGLFEHTTDQGKRPYLEISKEVPDAQGATTRQSLLVGYIDRLKEILGKADEVLRELQPQYWPVVGHVEATRDGARARVEKAFRSRDEAELYAHGKPVIAWHEPLKEEPKKGQELFARVDEKSRRIEENRELDRRRRQLIWEAQAGGKSHTFGRWFDRESRPRVGQKVILEPVHEYRGEPRDHRIRPMGQGHEPGEPEKPIFVAVERDPKQPGLATVRAIGGERRKIIEVKNVLAEPQEAIRRATDNRLWKQVTLSPGLRRHGHTLTVRTFARGGARADVIERLHEDGRRERTVFLTRRVREADGAIRTVGKLYELDQLKKLRAAYEAARQAEPEPGQGGAPEPRRGPQASRSAPSKQAQEPSPKASDPAPEVPDNKHYVHAVWPYQDPPRKGQWVRFPLGKATPEERRVSPVSGRARDLEPGTPPRHVVLKRVFHKRVPGEAGVGVVHGATRNAAHAADRTETLERGERVKQQRLEARMEEQRARQREQGLSLGM